MLARALDFAARLADRLAGLQRFEQRQFLGARADALRGLQQNGGALGTEECRPAAVLEGLARNA